MIEDLINKQTKYNTTAKAFLYKFNFDDLVKYLLVLRFDKHLLSSTIDHEYYQRHSRNKNEFKDQALSPN